MAFSGQLAQKTAVLASLLGIVVASAVYEEHMVATGSKPSRALLSDTEPSQIYSGDKIVRSLDAGYVYFACSAPMTHTVNGCMGYEYESSGPLLAFVVNQTLYKSARAEHFVNMMYFTHDTIEKNSLCSSPQCSRTLDFGGSKEWCLAFVNTEVPDLNYCRVEEKSVDFSYSFHTCISSREIPQLLIQGGILLFLVIASVGLMVFWIFNVRRKPPTPQHGVYETLLVTPKASFTKPTTIYTGGK